MVLVSRQKQGTAVNKKKILPYISTYLILCLVIGSLAIVKAAEQTQVSLPSTGTIIYGSFTAIDVDPFQTIGQNTFALGFQIDYPWEWEEFRDRPAQLQLAQDANFKLVRVFERHWGPLDYSEGVGPCRYWDESTKTGTFDWSDVDSVVQAIYSTGAEPLICLSAWSGGSPTVPPGMAKDPNTLLPYPESYAAFAATWVQHFIDVGIPVRYYEVFNEIQTYVGWSYYERDEARVAHFIDLFNAAYLSMHEVKSDVIVSFDASTLSYVFPRLLSHGVGIDIFNFHKYDDWKNPPNAFSDEVMFQRTEDVYFQKNDMDTLTVDYVRDTWYEQRGEYLPFILSEGNWNAAYGPTDERIQQMAGAARIAMVIRLCMLNDVSYNIFYTLTSDAYWQTLTYGSGRGFGMIDSNTMHSASQSYDRPWYPYYVHYMIGPNLNVGDQIIDVQTSSEDIRCIGWNNGETTNILLIHKDKGEEQVIIRGLQGTLNIQWIDDSVSYLNPSIQSKSIQANEGIYLDGYTVALIQGEAGSSPPPPPPPPPGGDIVVDDTQASYVGTWHTSSTTSGYYGSGYRYHIAGSGSNTATWSFTIPQAASYEVYARWTSASNRAKNAPYTVYHAGGSSTVRVNQEVNSGEWVSLGEFDFDAGGASVRLSDDADDVVIADAIMLVYATS